MYSDYNMYNQYYAASNPIGNQIPINNAFMNI